ncbi:MAG: helicase-exonuclease AddAB subunit AddA, partial [Acetanaerobacterium sp.]
MARNWTPEQAQAIDARGGSLLVSAAAGSGKTAVLVERVIRRIEDPINPMSADRLVVATFSNAAAAEIRERVEAALDERLSERPDDYGLRRQQMLLAKAHIGTIHSFCLDIIRHNFQALSIPCDSRIGDENGLALLQNEACEEIIEDAYALGDDRFLELVELVSSARDDRALVQTIQRLHGFVRSHPFADDWLRETLAQYDPDLPLPDTRWGETILASAAQALTHAQRSLAWAVGTISGDERLAKAYLAAFNEDENNARALCKLVQGREWDALYKRLRTCEFARLGALRGFEDAALKQRLTAVRKGYKDIVTALRERQFCATLAQHRDDMCDLYPKVEVLFSLVRAFSARYDEKKRERGLLDFPDLEQLALRLLVEKTDGVIIPTPLARTIAEGIGEIFIDEYQDVNEAQNEIFGAVSQNRQNLFMVGDVKQSIYRFRQAMPELFLRYKDEFFPYDGAHYPAKITLGRNFRSRGCVTDAVNFIFHQIMSREAGEIDYSGDELLIPAAQYPDSPLPRTHLHILDLSQAADDEAAAVLEARHIAGEIHALLRAGLTVTDGGRQRAATFGDFAILLRSVRDRAPVYAAELAACGIPVLGEAGGDALRAREVAVLLALLRVIDNPLSDIDLAAVLLSPMFLFTATELAALRLAAPRAPLYLAAVEYAQQDEKTRTFLDALAALRTEAVSLSVDRLIERAYQLTDYDLRVRAMTNGARRMANLRLLSEYARSFEQAGYGGLPGFVRQLTRMTEEGLTLGEAPVFFDTDDTVRILSIHKSKGLEFPVCFVADCAKQFNRRDTAQQSLLHSRLGFSCKRREPEALKQYTTIPHEALKLAITQGAVAEEMRVLYVALTRAREHLFITAAEKNPEKKLAKLGVSITSRETLDPFAAMSAGSFSDWVLTAALRRPEADGLRELAGLDDSVLLDTAGEDAWEIRLIPPPEADVCAP